MSDMKIQIEEAERALVEKPIFATSVERFAILDDIKEQYAELSQPLRFAKFMSILLSRVSVPLEPWDLVAGRCVDRELSDEEEARFQAFRKDKNYPRGKTIYDAGHCIYEWEYLVEHGLVGLRKKAEVAFAAQDDEEKRNFLLAIIEIYDAIRDYMLRYAEAAREKGMDDLAAALTSAATEKPATFRTALQLLWSVTFILCAYVTHNPTLTVGRMDQLLYPFYRKEIDAGTLTREEAAHLITDYYCKHNLIMGRGEHQVGDATNSTTFDRILCFDAPQYLMLAGTDGEGRSAVNDLTLLFAECIRPKFKNPVVVVRYFIGMDKGHPDLWKILTEKALASASLMFYNDDNIISTLKRIGFPDADAREYSHFGCNWATAGPHSAWMKAGPRAHVFGAPMSAEERSAIIPPYMRYNTDHGWAEDFMIVMRELATRDSVTIDDFYDGFFARMGDFMDRQLTHLSLDLTARKRRPAGRLTFADCFYSDSVKNGECFAAGAKYHFELQAFAMFGTVADCFITVDKLVFVDKKLTLGELLAAVDADFVGHERTLALCRSVDKYGSDTPHSNAHAERLAETFCQLAVEKSRPYFEKQRLFLEPCIQSDTWHLKYGETFGATPDGRRAGAAFSQNAKPSNGACTNGLGAMLNAMLRIPADGMLSGALNLDVDPKQFSGEEGRALFAAVLAAYFNRGGLHAQVSSVSAEDLLAAQKDPDAYRDLRVRVTGYSGIFVDMCERLQDDVIERMK